LDLDVLQLDRVSKTIWRGAHALPVLEDVSLEVRAGQLVAVGGSQRAGKTTLLRVAGGLLGPDAGVVRFDGADLAQLSAPEHAELLAERIAWARCGDAPPRDVRALQHVATPLLPRHGRRAAEQRAAEALALVGAERCARGSWDRLSDRERTLVTLARALARHPSLLLVDDPTLGLRADECEQVVELLRTQAETRAIGVLITVAERPATRRAHRRWSLRDGRLIPAPAPPDDDGARVVRLPVRR
jgi:predicted ABC-type transport system involved in lysophospholipase L1 biosynthesis ATPase subunit